MPIPKRSASPRATSTLEVVDSLKALDPDRPIREEGSQAHLTAEIFGNANTVATASLNKFFLRVTQPHTWASAAILSLI